MNKPEEKQFNFTDKQLKDREHLKKILGIDKLYPEPGWEEARLKQPVFTTGVSCSGCR